MTSGCAESQKRGTDAEEHVIGIHLGTSSGQVFEKGIPDLLGQWEPTRPPFLPVDGEGA